jgi:hypothetical protein
VTSLTALIGERYALSSSIAVLCDRPVGVIQRHHERLSRRRRQGRGSSHEP